MVDLHQPNLTSKETNIAKRMRNYARRYNLCFLELKFCPEQWLMTERRQSNKDFQANIEDK